MEKTMEEIREDLNWLVSLNPMGKEDLIQKLKACKTLGKDYLCVHTDTFDWTEYITFDCPTHQGSKSYVGDMEKCMDSYRVDDLLTLLSDTNER